MYPAYYSSHPSNPPSPSLLHIQCLWKKANVLPISLNAPPFPSTKNPSPGVAMKYAYRCTSGLSSIQGIASSRNRRICSTVPSGLNSVIQIGRPCATFLVASMYALKECTLATPYLRTRDVTSRWKVREGLGKDVVPVNVHKINTSTPSALA